MSKPLDFTTEWGCIPSLEFQNPVLQNAFQTSKSAVSTTNAFLDKGPRGHPFRSGYGDGDGVWTNFDDSFAASLR